jgi:hypothetical protein
VADDDAAAARLARLRRQIADGTLAPADFHHQDHLLLALALLRHLDFAAALAELRPGLQALAARAGKPERYHETRTAAWLTLVARVQYEHGHEPLPRVIDALLSHCGDNGLLDRHYSAALLDSDEARAHFVPPDRTPF